MEYQVSWLRVYGVERVIVASREVLDPNLDVEYSIEYEKLGTGGAIKQAMKKCSSDYVYVMNVDDIVFCNPMKMLRGILRDRSKVGVILGALAKHPFGVMEAEGNIITAFIQKPTLPYYTNAGHYLFNRRKIMALLPDKGDFEDTVLPKLASRRMLLIHKYHGVWITINTMKDLLRAREVFKRGVE